MPSRETGAAVKILGVVEIPDLCAKESQRFLTLFLTGAALLTQGPHFAPAKHPHDLSHSYCFQSGASLSGVMGLPR